MLAVGVATVPLVRSVLPAFNWKAKSGSDRRVAVDLGADVQALQCGIHILRLELIDTEKNVLGLGVSRAGLDITSVRRRAVETH